MASFRSIERERSRHELLIHGTRTVLAALKDKQDRTN